MCGFARGTGTDPSCCPGCWASCPRRAYTYYVRSSADGVDGVVGAGNARGAELLCNMLCANAPSLLAYGALQPGPGAAKSQSIACVELELSYKGIRSTSTRGCSVDMVQDGFWGVRPLALLCNQTAVPPSLDGLLTSASDQRAAERPWHVPGPIQAQENIYKDRGFV